jgi:lysophospholipase L1-like esterase
MSNFFSKNKWLIIGGLGILGLGVVTAILLESITPIKNKNPKKILFLGDSITASDISYANQIKQNLKGLDITIKASVGKKTSWMLQSLIDLLKTNSYDRIYVYGGINDIFSGVSRNEALSNIQQIVDLGNSKGSDVFVIEGIEPKGFMDIEKMPLTQYISNKDQYLPLIEKYDDFQNNLKAIKKAKLIKRFNINGETGDGIHPNSKGQQSIFNEILKTI